MKRHLVSLKFALALLTLLMAQPARAATPAELGLDKEIWITVRTDGKPGTGTLGDPLDGSTQEKFDSVMNRLYTTNQKNLTIHLGVGTFRTLGSYVYVAYNATPGWIADDGWKILGAGMGNTIVKLSGFTYLDPGRIDVAVQDGVWTTKADLWFQVGQEVKLVSGEGLSELAPATVYYVSEVIDSKSFKVAASLGGPTINKARIAAGGKFQKIDQDAFNTVIVNRPWNKQDVEVKDMTIDCSWTEFGTTLSAPFTVPAAMQTVTVDVQSSAWAQVNKRVYLQQMDYRVVGVYQVVSIDGPHRLVLRNLANPSLGNPKAGQPDNRFRQNLPAGTVVPKETRVCPRMNAAGIGLSAARCHIERVRVTNVGAPIYEGNCGINVAGIGTPGPTWPAASEIVVRDCIVDNIWGQYGWPIQIHGNNTNVPSLGYGTQALIEGNTIYGNGLHQGLGGWNYVNSFWINNKVVNCTSPFFTDSANCWNNMIKNNMFLECKSYMMVLGGGFGAWNPKSAYAVGDTVFWSDVNYRCKAAHTNQQPPDDRFWEKAYEPAFSSFDKYVFEGNVFEVCDNSGPILFNGNVANSVFRNNIVRYAPGHSKKSKALHFANPTNRRLIVTGNIIDSRLKNEVGDSIVFGKDNVDETGKIRPELEKSR